MSQIDLVNEDPKCKKCGEKYANILTAKFKWCNPCQISCLKKNFTKMTSGNENIDNLIQEMQLKINSPFTIVFEWIPYNQFRDIREIGKGCFSTVSSAIWKDGPLHCDYNKEEWKRETNKKVALKCLYNSHNITVEFINEVKTFSMSICGNILKIYGISQNPETNDYIMVLDYAEGGNIVDWINKNYKSFNWSNRIQIVKNIIDGLREVHQKQIVHRHLHPRNILLKFQHGYIVSYISDMGLSEEVGNIDHSKIYGIMPYVAPEILRGGIHTQSADIYSFGMIMYFIATGRQPFSNYAHDQYLAFDICNGIRPEVNEPEVPRCYIDLMRKCWDSNPDNRPNTKEIYELITLFSYSYKMDALHFKLFVSIEKEQQHYEIESQFKEAEKHRRANLSFNINNQSPAHSRSVYTSRLLNPFIKDLLKHDSSSKPVGITKLSIQDTNNDNKYAKKEI